MTRRLSERFTWAARLVLLAGALPLSACGPAADPAPAGPDKSAQATPGRASSGRVTVARARRKTPPSQLPAPGEPEVANDHAQLVGDARHQHDAPSSAPSVSSAPEPDAQQLADEGIRRLIGTHLTLYTDLAEQPEIDELPRVFDAAVAPWCTYFRVSPSKAAHWKMTCCIMNRRERFQAAGLLPDDLPPFLNGYQRGSAMWVYEQPSAYYRRHMLLHEGTHAFMNTLLSGSGPPWYMEGIAELLGTHRWQDGAVQLGYFPRQREDVPQWGRIKMVRDETSAGRSMTLEAIMQYGPTAHLKNEPYAWCWAAAAFLDGHPQFSERFRQLPRHVRASVPEFDAAFDRLFAADQRQLMEQWQLFVQQLDYGYDLVREAIVYDPPGEDLQGSRAVQIRADRGWQSSGILVAARTTYVFEATGRYQLAREPATWWCEPGGVTIRYHDGRPLGMVLAAASDQSQPLQALSPLAQPQPIGLGATVAFDSPGTLFLRINDVSAELADNEGEVTVRIRRADSSNQAPN